MTAYRPPSVVGNADAASIDLQYISNKLETESKLRKLCNAHRLAVHMSEGAQPFGFPHRSLRDFQEMAAADKHIPEEATAGDFIYVGQGKKELTKVALEALDTLQKSDALMQIERAGDFYTPDRISDALRSQLRLMIEVPLSQQKAQVDWLKKDAGISVPIGGIT